MFVIATGCYVGGFLDHALATAGAMAEVHIDMGATACKVPDAAAYIAKVRARGSLGKKCKTVKC